MNPASTPLFSVKNVNPIRWGRQDLQYLTNSYASPPPKLPCGDLLENRDDYHKICLPLHNASVIGDWRAAQVILHEHPHLELLGFGITENYDTALHVAASAKSSRSVEKFVRNLVRLMTKEQLELQNLNYNTALCLAAASGNVKIVDTMLRKNRALLDIPGSQGMMPLCIACLFEKTEMVNYLYDNGNQMRGDYWTDEKRGWVLQQCVEADLFGVALKIVTHRPELTVNGSLLRVLARNTNAFREKRRYFFAIRILISFYAVFDKNLRGVDNSRVAMLLLRILWTNTMKLPKSTIDDIIRGPADIIRGPSDVIVTEDGKKKPKHSSHMLFVAAEMGNTKFLVELIRQYPDLIWSRNDNNQTIFHVAVSHRHVEIYTLLYETGLMKDLITPLKDGEGNNMLHLVGKRPRRKHFPLRYELIWFKEIEDLVPLCCRREKNKDGLTPHELFMEEHKDQFSENEKWMKDTANQSLVVAALIASIAFAAAITVPGGNDQTSGIPTFLHKGFYMVFAASDALSLILSSTSILIFLSIFISGYAEIDFMKPLPQKMVTGLAALFCSIVAMLVAFIAGYFLVYQNKLIWFPLLISLIVFIPVFLFADYQFLLLKDFIVTMDPSGHFFRPNRHRLYYQHPRI